MDRAWLRDNVPCLSACPLLTHVPEYVEAIQGGNYEHAYRVNRRDNVFPHSLGRVCTKPCETACRRAREIGGEPVAICHLKRAAAEYGHAKSEPLVPPSGKSVCVVGAGPAGLTAANDLALRGYAVIVLERWEQPGGLLRYGIPAFRLPHDVLDRDIQSIRDLGVEIRCNASVDDAALERMRHEFDAVVLAYGSQPAEPALSDGEAEGLFEGLRFLVGVGRGALEACPERTVVAGGGFTAIDCARTAQRLGARHVRVVYECTRAQMRAGNTEIDRLDEEGIEIEFLASPVKVVTRDGRVAGLRLVRNRLEARRPVPIPGSEFEMPCEAVILTTEPANSPTGAKDRASERALRSDSNVFVAGDLQRGPGTVVEACADGRRAARQVHRHLSGHDEEELICIELAVPSDLVRVRRDAFIPRQRMPRSPLNERRRMEQEVETGYTQELAECESRRCYRCHYRYEIDVERCIGCLACVDAMPVDCIKLIRDFDVADDGVLRFVEATQWGEAIALAIDGSRCIRCGQCAQVCPVDCVEVQKYSLARRKRP